MAMVAPSWSQHHTTCDLADWQAMDDLAQGMYGSEPPQAILAAAGNIRLAPAHRLTEHHWQECLSKKPDDGPASGAASGCHDEKWRQPRTDVDRSGWNRLGEP